jgi:hypothetical protein
MHFDPICPPCENPAKVPESQAFVILPRIFVADAEAVAKKSILESFARPADIARAELAPAELLFVPFWRVDVTVDGFYVGLTYATGTDGRLQWVLPTGGARHRDAVLAICARRLFPYRPPRQTVAPLLARGFGTVAPLTLRLEEMVPRSSAGRLEGTVLDADVSREDAEREAKDILLHAARPARALYAEHEARVRSTSFVHYPIVLVRYRYTGEASPEPGQEFHVGVSARSGKIVTSRHPSIVRALAAKFRRLLTL